MISNDFIVSDYYELLALHRALLEAKFCDEPNDFDVSASPIIASLHKKLLQSLIKLEVEQKGSSAQDSWNNWLAIDPERREWNVGLQRARDERLWCEWSKEDKKKYILDLLSPFHVDNELAEIFLNQV